MNAGHATPPKYNLLLVERAVLEAAIELHPQRLTVDELALRIVADHGDGREVETAIQAVRGLRRSGLLRYRSDDEVVEPTPPAFRAHTLLVQ